LWWGLLAPAGTPSAITQRLNAAVNQALAKHAIRNQFLAEGAEVKPLTAAQFGHIIARDIERWKQLAVQQHIVTDQP
jgi:tripartite-type tricarboxylate transporter receptor subunit TctC